MGHTPSSHSELIWHHHPARRRPLALALAIAYVTAATGALHLGFRTPWLTLLGAACLLAAAAEFLFPTAYTLDQHGASARGPLGQRRLAWLAVRSALLVDHGGQRGVLLSPIVEPGLARRMRSLWLPAAEEGQPTLDELVGWVERHATERQVPEVAHG